MKIYAFCPQTGIYQGEDFIDQAAMKGSGRELPGATTFAPPPYGRGEVPVFIAAENRWIVRQVRAIMGSARPSAKGEYSAGLTENEQKSDILHGAAKKEEES